MEDDETYDAMDVATVSDHSKSTVSTLQKSVMTFTVTKPQQELVPIMTQIGGGSGGGASSRSHRFHPGGNLSIIPNLSLSPSKRRKKRKSSAFCCLSMLVILFVAFALAFPYLLSAFESLVHYQATKSKGDPGINFDNNDDDIAGLRIRQGDSEAPPSLIWGTVGDDNVSYYHQPAWSPTEENHHLVLLHGAAFSKEDWKTSGIFREFQKSFPSLTVTALDLPVSASHGTLARLLRSMRDEDLVEQLPVSALVTPSASGYSITSWIREESSEGMSSYLSAWIPVASYSVSQCSSGDLETLRAQWPDVSVLAIYGSEDGKGKSVMESLRDHAGAELLELPGRHPVYLDSPSDFVVAVGNAVMAIE